MPQRMLGITTTVLLITTCVLGTLGSRDSAAKNPSGYDYEEYEETYNNNQNQPSFDYGGEVINVKVTEAPLMCYSCELTVLEDGHTEGFTNCNEPFSREDIPEVQCKGVCSKKYELKGPRSYSIRRGCLPNCRDRAIEGKEYVQCCKTTLCNSSATLRPFNDNGRYLLLTVSAAFISVLAAR